MKKVYCVKCDKDVNYVLKPVKKEYKVKDDTVEVEINEALCADCGRPLFVFSVEKENQTRVYDAYKKKHNLLTSKEIIAIRKRHHMSQRELAKKIKIGEKNIARYENGAIQDQSINLLIRLFDKIPECFDELCNEEASSLKFKDIKTSYYDSEELFETKIESKRIKNKCVKGAYCNA